MALLITFSANATAAHHGHENDNIKMIEAYFSSLAAGDMETFAGFFAENVVWHQPGKNKYSGAKNGFRVIGQMIGGMMQDTQGTFVVKQNGDVMANGNLVSVEVAFSGKKGNTSIDMTGHDLFKIKDGKIVEVWLFSEDQKAEDAFWGK
ncbi:ketosteroid isomerase [Veronia nyctiphanis]|uniref:Ketosteroid isomerase n=2 Tax=Veronia nyctiphanis TaxID=1278244 RepID=A0A4Q0YQA6_9GAMM|nr:ketosteroid isomerase [Veronia nyctiphanis]